MRRKIFISLPFVVLLLGFFTMRFLLSFREDAPKREVVVRPKIVQTRVVELGDTPAKLVAYGRLASSQPVVLNSEVSGELLQGDVPFQPAQSFRKGDLLARIDDRQMRLDLNSAKSDFLNALATVLPEIKIDFPDQVQVWQDYFNNTDFEKPLEPLPEATDQKIKLFLSRFNVYRLFFAARNLEIRLEKHYFYAPFDGTILSTDLRIGSTARPGARLGEIINLEDMEVEIPVPAEDIRWIDRRAPVKLFSEELDAEWRGRINRIGQSIDERTQTVPAFISIVKNGHPFYNGIFLRAEIPGATISSAVSVPLRAIYEDRFVYVIENGVFATRDINITFRESDSCIIDSGLADGDTLVVELLQGVAPGMPAQSSEAAGTGDGEESVAAAPGMPAQSSEAAGTGDVDESVAAERGDS